MSPDELVLRHRDTTVVVQGGELLSLRSWRVAGSELLADPAALPAHYRVHGRRAGVTLMHPWANRLGADVFAVAGRELAAPEDETVSRDGSGLAIHGLTAPGAWCPEGSGDHGTVVRVVPATSAFPFAHTVSVELRVGVRCVAVVTRIEAAQTLVPVSFGWHPYFVPAGSRADWELGLPRRELLALDDRGLPTGQQESRPAERGALGARRFDDGYTGVAHTTWSIGDIDLELGDGYDCAQVFAPSDCDVVGLEPMTAPTDALRSGDGLRLLPAGSRHAASFKMSCRG